MRMLIANNCLTVHVYQKQNREYDNPFFGNRIFCKDFQKLMENFETIDYENVDICLNDDLHHTDPKGTPKRTVSIILPGNIRVLYQHIEYSKDDLIPRRVNNTVYYYKNYEYALNSYLRRIKRMKMTADKLFIFSDNEVPGFSTEEDRINLIKTAERCKKKMLFITEKEKYKQYENDYCKVLVIDKYDFGRIMNTFWNELQ